MSFHIYPLHEKPEFAETCAAWSFAEWVCQIDGRNLSETIERYKDSVNHPDAFPKTWICLREDNKPVGMVSMKIKNHPDRLDLFPWLSSVYIHPAYRGQGLLKKLIAKVEETAQNEGYQHLYVFSHTANEIYAKYGWKALDRISDPTGLNKDGDILMKKNLQAE